MNRTPNHEQQKVIDDLRNNIILYASAGTGKTFTVANRIKNILERRLAKPEEILCLTFTIKACNEMREDIAQYVGLAAKKINIKTIHGFCLSLLKTEAKKRNDLYTDIDVCDDVDETDLLLRLIAEEGSVWAFEDYLNEMGIPAGINDLYSCDVYYDIGKRELCWIFESDGQVLSISRSGNITAFEGSINDFRERIIRVNESQNVRTCYCDYCKVDTGKQIINVCRECGYDFRQMLPFFKTPLLQEKPDELRNIISTIKHCRYNQNFYSDNETLDFQQAIDFLKENKKFCPIFTFYSRQDRTDVEDYELEEFFLKYGGQFLHLYCNLLRESNYLDYDDLIIEAAHLLSEPETQAYWEKLYRFITIDEMQDTNETEYEVLERLFGNNRIMLCGDFFQTIYGWRGSKPEIVLNKYIEKHHATIYMFQENYRSTEMLANASFGYLKNTYPELIGKYCPPKLIIHSRESGRKIQHYSFATPLEEAKFVFSYILENFPDEPTLMCVMARSNSYIASLAKQFDNLNKDLPDNQKLRYFTVEQNQAFYKTPVVKDILAFLKILLNKTDNLSMERIARGFIAGVGEKTIEQLHNYNHIGVNICAFLNPDTFEYGDNYHTLIDAAMAGNIVVYDTETTGLDLSKDQVIQIAAIRYDALGNAVDTFNEIVIPTVEVSQGARDTVPFDIDKEIRERGISARQAFIKFSDFVKGSVLVGHNSNGYDAPLIARQLTELRLPELDVAAQYDTLVLSKQFYSRLPNFKLATICDSMGIINEDAHNALGDVQATGNVLFEILREKLIGSQKERKKILKKYSYRFERFFNYIGILDSKLSAGCASELIDDIIRTCKLETKYKTFTAQKTVQDVRSLIKNAENDDTRTIIQDFVSNASMSGSQMDNLIKKLNQIPLITVHQSKGCEFENVIMVGVNDNHFPSYAAQIHGTTDEEKRVFYVAISRAKRNLIMTCPLKEGNWERNISPYTNLIPAYCISRK